MPPKAFVPPPPFSIKPTDAEQTLGTSLDSQHGIQAIFKPTRGERGVITEVFPDTHQYHVVTKKKVDYSAIGRLLVDPGDNSILPVGTEVAVSHEFGIPLIVGVLPSPTWIQRNSPEPNITGVKDAGGADPAEAGKGVGNFRSIRTPQDLGQDDWAKVSPDGNSVAVLRGGVNIMKSGLAQFRTHLLNDFAEIICRNFRQITDMGISEIKNEGGRLNWSFRGGVDKGTEAGADQENWTIKMDLGNVGSLFNFEFCDGGGKTSFKFYVTQDGHWDIVAMNGINVFTAGPSVEVTQGNREVTVEGSDTQVVKGLQKKSLLGDRITQVSGKDSKTVGVDGLENYVRNLNTIVGGQQTEKIVGGNPLVANPLNIARETYINNGSWKIYIGDPLAGSNPAALASYAMKVYTGDIKHEVVTKGDITHETKVGDVTLNTLLGNATLKTFVGKANVDGTTVHLGNVKTSLVNPVIKGTEHTTALTTFLSTMKAANGTLSAATTGAASAASAALTPGGTVDTGARGAIGAIIGYLSAHAAALSGWSGAEATLASTLPSTLSKKSFTE